MPLIEEPLPALLATLKGPSPPNRPHLIFYADIDPETGKMWCGDCRDVEGDIKAAFGAEDGPTGIIIYVGNRPTWKDPNNKYRLEYGLTGTLAITPIPTIIRLQDGIEADRLVEGEIKDKTKLAAFTDIDVSS
ncbi:uncharacterized protein EI90DRAFT_3122134 [Cantharellus anzutake]|uniref:uncharacterized protein n=1 Tax=Cantharellus anzutake TaxID=1750568 RepID=UPI00190573EE|nr:uncharacterized protein EI90DRAFT_3122134 [Cantharellus anzutake]KAF8333085.1 hypothetical protein EI90DRAFT_3122134 [Cantharellus anzutake]